jgi:signal transduction histidine kinase
MNHAARASAVANTTRWVWLGGLLLVNMTLILLMFTLYNWHWSFTTPCDLERYMQNCEVMFEWFKTSRIPLELYAVLYVLSLVIPALVWLGLGVFVLLEKKNWFWGVVFALYFLTGWFSDLSHQSLGKKFPIALEHVLGMFGVVTTPWMLDVAAYWRGISKMIADNLIVLVAFSFPDGKLYPLWAKWYLLAFFVLSLGYSLPDLRPTLFNYGNWVPLINIPTHVLLIAVSLYVLIVRFRRSSQTVRRQMREILPAMIVTVLTYVLIGYMQTFLLPAWFGATPFEREVVQPLIQLFNKWLNGATLIWLAVAVAKAIVREQLFDIRFVLNRAFAYSILTISSIGLYALIVGGLGSVFVQAQLGLSVLGAGVLAVFFQPMLVLFRGFSNRLFYGHRSDPYQALSVFGRRLEAARNPDELPQQIVQTIASTLRLPYVAIQTRNQNGAVQIVDVGTRLGELLEFPMAVKGTAVGSLLVSKRHASEQFSALERHLLEDLAAQAAVAMREVLLSQALQASKQDIVLAREEERKRIRRDLHDGLGASLTSISMNLQLSRTVLASDPSRAEGLLENSALGVQAAIADIRRLVYGLRPPALDDLGLEGALRQQVGQMLGVVTDVQILPLEPLPAAVEVAAYRIVSEALNNIAKHSRAKYVKLVVQMTEDGLMLEVADDGVGFLPNQAGGLGLSSMRERALELGGMFEFESTRGTRILAWLPLAGRTYG